MRQKRGALSIMQSILLALKEGPDIKTNIGYKAKIDSRTIARYLPLLVKLHLVTRIRSRKYKITRKGVAFLKQYAKLKKYNAIS